MNELINLPQTAPTTCAGVQFGALHLAKICTCSSPNCTLSQFIGAVRQRCSLANCTNEFLLGAVRRTAPVTELKLTESLMKVVEGDVIGNCSKKDSDLILESMLFVTDLLIRMMLYTRPAVCIVGCMAQW